MRIHARFTTVATLLLLLGTLLAGCAAPGRSGETDQGQVGQEDVYCSRALVYHRLGDLPQALADYNRAVELDPKDGYAYYGRARLYLDLDLDDEAIEDFKQVVTLGEEDCALPAGMVAQARETLRELGD